jgi:hypothetical protein
MVYCNYQQVVPNQNIKNTRSIVVSSLFIKNNISKSYILKTKKEKLIKKIKVNMIQKSKTFQELQKMKDPPFYF